LAGVVGAAAIALWFLALDGVKGRPFYTPTVLGTALFRGGAGLQSPETLPIDFEMVLSFTWVHVLAFLIIGVGASRLLGIAERNPSFGFGIVLLFVVFEFGFLLVCMLFAEPVLRALTWPAFRDTLEQQRDTLRGLVHRPCQTNEVGRAAALFGGFLLVARETGLPLRLLEIGASAGLNLRWDHYRYEQGDAGWGDRASP